MSEKRKFGLSGNMLKIIAAISMVIDHTGMILFPWLTWPRILGRLAFPIFAYLIYEGCRYTRNKLKYLLIIFLLGLVTSVPFSVTNNHLCFTVLVTFSFSILLVYLIHAFENATNTAKKFLFAFIFCALTVFLFFLNLYEDYVFFEYGFWGMMLPALPALVSLIKKPSDKILLFNPHLYAIGIGLLLLAFTREEIQFFGLLALIPLAFYNGKRGFKLPKYSFYIFYPSHILILYGIDMAVRYFS